MKERSLSIYEDLIHGNELDVENLVRVEGLVMIAVKSSGKVGVADVVHKGGVGIDFTDKGELFGDIPGLFRQLAGGRCLRRLTVVDNAAGELEGDSHDAMTVLPDHDETLLSVTVFGDGDDISPVRGVQEIVIGDPATGPFLDALIDGKHHCVEQSLPAFFFPTKMSVTHGRRVEQSRSSYKRCRRLDTVKGTGKECRMVYDRIRSLIDSLRQGLVERDEALRLTLLSALAGESVALLGPVGVGKSLIGRRVIGAFKTGDFFEIALDGFTTPDELFGPLSLELIKSGAPRIRNSNGYLPKARFVSLENIWNGSRPLRDAILPVLADRKVRNGAEEERAEWRLLLGTADYLPPIEEVSRPFWDRFLIRIAMEPIASSERFKEVLTSEAPRELPPENQVTDAEWSSWSSGISAVELTEEVVALIGRVREALIEQNRKRDGNGEPAIYVSDRRWHALTKLLKASAYFHDRDKVGPLDCILLRHGIWERPEQIEEVNEVIRQAIAEHAQSDRFDTKRLRLEFRRLSDEIENHRIDYHEEEIREFERFRGEYFIVDEFIEDLTTLIWIDDFQNLSTETAKNVELFFYGENDVLSHTDTFSVRRAGEGSVEINGDVFPLRGRSVSRSVADRRPLSGTEAKDFRERLAGLQDACRHRIKEIAALRTSGESEANGHLFVKQEYAKLLLDGLEESETQLVELESEMAAYEAEAFLAEE